MCFMALTGLTTVILCVRSQKLVMPVSVRRVHVVLSTLLDLRAVEFRVLRHVKRLHCGEVYRKPRALCWDRTQASGAIAQGFTTN